MPDIDAVLDRNAADRAGDPFAPVTVIAPSRVALLQLRRRLAQRGPYANASKRALASAAPTSHAVAVWNFDGQIGNPIRFWSTMCPRVWLLRRGSCS